MCGLNKTQSALVRVEKSSGRRGVLRKGVLLARLPLLPGAPEDAAMGEAKGDSGESSEEEETLAAVRL
mgnify:CR=1 FL=1